MSCVNFREKFIVRNLAVLTVYFLQLGLVGAQTLDEISTSGRKKKGAWLSTRRYRRKPMR